MGSELRPIEVHVLLLLSIVYNHCTVIGCNWWREDIVLICSVNRENSLLSPIMDYLCSDFTIIVPWNEWPVRIT